MADPVDLNPLFDVPRSIKKAYQSIQQPPTPSPSEFERLREGVESENTEVAEVEVSYPYRKVKPFTQTNSKVAFGLTPCPEGSTENSPLPGATSRVPSRYALPRKVSYSANAFLSPSDDPDYIDYSFAREAAKYKMQQAEESGRESPAHSQAKQKKVEIDLITGVGIPEFAKCKPRSSKGSDDLDPEGKGDPKKASVPDPEAGPSRPGTTREPPASFLQPFVTPSTSDDDPSSGPSTTTSVFSPSSPSGESSPPRRKVPFPGPGRDPSEDPPEDMSPMREDEFFPDFIVDNNPFKYGAIDNFIKDEQFLNDLASFIQKGDGYKKRDSDMFTYHQMDDELFMSNPLTRRLVTTMVKKVIPFMTNITGTDLNPEKVTISASKYKYTDHLLCHDDLSGDRCIAFILYLNKEWQRMWGGTLDLYQRDFVGNPREIAASLVPEFNRLLFFEVTHFSFHQVAEVLKHDGERISINGWFHYGKPPAKTKVSNEPAMLNVTPEVTKVPEKEFDAAIAATWLGAKYELDKKKEFLSTRHTVLASFLEPKVYERAFRELGKSDWTEVGPPNRRRFEILPEELLSPFLQSLCTILISRYMFSLVWRYTSRRLCLEAFQDQFGNIPPHERPPIQFIGVLPLKDIEAEMERRKSSKDAPPDPRCSIFIRRWKKGFYATALDDEHEITGARGHIVDVCLTVGPTAFMPPKEGGYTAYVDRTTGIEKYRFHPCGTGNALHISELSSDYYRYTKYINDKSNGVFYDFTMLFKT